MRAGGGHAKGAAFERQVCDHLSRWVDPRGTDTHFWRSSMSGGRATIKHRAGKLTKSQAGDLSSLTRIGHPLLSKFFVECKFVKDLSIQGALISRKGLLASYWYVLEVEAAKHDKLPLMIAKENRSPTLLFCLPQSAKFLGAVSLLEVACFKRLSRKGTPVACFIFDEFLANVKYAAHRFT